MFPRQHREWKKDVALAAILLVFSCSPLVKAISSSRSVKSQLHKATLTMHSALDLVMVSVVILWCSVAPGARLLGECNVKVFEAVVRWIATNAQDFQVAVNFFLDDCHNKDEKEDTDCDTKFNSVVEKMQTLEPLVNLGFCERTSLHFSYRSEEAKCFYTSR